VNVATTTAVRRASLVIADHQSPVTAAKAAGETSALSRRAPCHRDERLAASILPRILPRIAATQDDTSQHSSDGTPAASRLDITQQPERTRSESDF
jgi:hypothetical protein